MLDECLQMGCCSSRPTSLSAEQRSSGGSPNRSVARAGFKAKASYDSKARRIVNIGTSLDRQSTISAQSQGVWEDKAQRSTLGDGSNIESDDHFMDILMEREGYRDKKVSATSQKDLNHQSSEQTKSGMEREETSKEAESSSQTPGAGSSGRDEASFELETADGNKSQIGRQNSDSKSTASSVINRAVVAVSNDDKSIDDESNEASSEDELNMELLQQYINIDYEISQLEDRDALRLYHEKIELLEQLERELDMISFEAEEMAVRSELGWSPQSDRNRNAPGGEPDGTMLTNGKNKQQRLRDDAESGSIASGLSASIGSLSNKSSTIRRDPTQQRQQQLSQRATGPNKGQPVMAMSRAGSTARRDTNLNSNQKDGLELIQRDQKIDTPKESNLSYATIEEVFNRKIILEKERDRLKKEVEMVIIECDRLQLRYKKRDEILDKLFDGRTGNGLENHLEQQLNWLMEQKHYVDQVFYAWKRAETLTSQTCEQFASAYELLKRLPKVSDENQRKELSENVCRLLSKSRQDMEQAQRYNPNVDVPFFTEGETERFDQIIETIRSGSVKSSEYSHMATVVQFAYKRAVSIRLWLEQILQITIARDSFELAEEYKWIAIQLRKERISLINMKLQEPPYRQMAHRIRTQLASLQQQQRQQNQLQLDNSQRLAITDGRSTTPTAMRTEKQGGEVNRDSGIESDDIDIEEDIYRLLEMNKLRLLACVTASREAGTLQTTPLDAIGRPLKPPPPIPSGFHPNSNQLPSSSNGLNQSGASTTTTTTTGRRMSQHDQIMQARVQRRVRGEQPLAVHNGIDLGLMRRGQFEGGEQEATNAAGVTPDKSASIRVLSETGNTISQTPSKLRIQLDEESRRNLLKQVDSIHSRHRSKLDNLRDSNQAKANDILMRLQGSRQQINPAEQIGSQPG